MPTRSETPMNNPYSLSNTMAFFRNNFGLLLIAGSTLLIGFIAGSFWTENSLLKAGRATGTAPIAAASPAPAATAGEQAAGPLSDADWQEIQKNPAAVIGNPNAKLTMVEFTDYQCPFCGRHFRDTHGTLMKNYVDAGKMKIVIKDQPLPFHPNALPGAMAARCAGEQGKYLQMHDQLFGNQDAWSNLGKEAAIEEFAKYAGAIGADGAALKACINSNKFADVISQDSQLGNRVGAGGTPTFFIEKQPLVGAQPLSEFSRIIDGLL